MSEIEKSLEDVYIFHLEKAYKQFKKVKAGFFKKVGIDMTSDQWILLKSISEEEGINQKALAKKCYKEPASVTRILDILERKGWVERRSVLGDRRSYELHATESGKALVEKVLPMAVELRTQGVAGLTEEEVEQFIRALKLIYTNFS